MPYIETIDDIIEGLADALGIYGAHDESCSDIRMCRCCWAPWMHDRLITALENEKLLANQIKDAGEKTS